METRNSTVFTVQLEVDAMAPELIAASASDPWRWKNLTRTANTAALPPTSAVKVLEVSSAMHRPNGSWPGTEPVTAHASATIGSCASTNVSATQPQLAPLMTSSDWPTSASTPMIAQIPISVPIPNTRLI